MRAHGVQRLLEPLVEGDETRDAGDAAVAQAFIKEIQDDQNAYAAAKGAAFFQELSKGQKPRAVVWRHAFRNAMLPVVTVVGIELAFLIGGLIVTESVFNLPGVARFLVEAILWRDYPMVQNLVMIIAIVVILSNLAVDMLYGLLDPRVRYGH